MAKTHAEMQDKVEQLRTYLQGCARPIVSSGGSMPDFQTAYDDVDGVLNDILTAIGSASATTEVAPGSQLSGSDNLPSSQF
jgi:hypothetical protein